MNNANATVFRSKKMEAHVKTAEACISECQQCKSTLFGVLHEICEESFNFCLVPCKQMAWDSSTHKKQWLFSKQQLTEFESETYQHACGQLSLLSNGNQHLKHDPDQLIGSEHADVKPLTSPDVRLVILQATRLLFKLCVAVRAQPSTSVRSFGYFFDTIV